jgi:hypothetical protein
MRDPRVFDVRVKPGDINKLCPGAVARVGQRSDERLFAQLGSNCQNLTGLHIGCEVDCQLGESR